MPELPEVETLARALRAPLLGKTILEAEVCWPRTIARPSARRFKEQIRGEQILSVARRAKYLHLQLSTQHLLIHLRMSGDVLVSADGSEAGKHGRLILHLSEGHALIFRDARKFGRVWLTPAPEEILGHLGPEPLSAAFTPQWLFQALRARRRRLKPLLLDQTFLAGLGNIYTDEALHRARLHPCMRSDALTPQQAERLHDSIRAVLEEGIRRNGASIDWVYRGGEFQNHFRVYGREGQPCRECGTPIQRIVVGQRGTYLCPNCQKDTEAPEKR